MILIAHDFDRRRPVCRAFLDYVKSISDFKLEWSPRRPPAASATCHVSVPLFLRQEFPQGTKSFGHLLRDNFEGLLSIAKKFGLTPAYFSWVMWPRTSGRGHWKEPSHVQDKYSSWLSKHPTYAWIGLVNACREGKLGSSTCSHMVWQTASSCARYVGACKFSCLSAFGRRVRACTGHSVTRF